MHSSNETFLFLILVIGSIRHWRTSIRRRRISVRHCRMCIRQWRIEPFRLQRYKIKGQNARVVPGDGVSEAGTGEDDYSG